MAQATELQFKKIGSLDEFPRADRLSIRLNLMTNQMEVSYHGREAKQIEINTALWYYHNALNTAEAQIEALLKIVRMEKAGEDTYDEELEYAESLEEDGDEDIRYKLDELKAGLFQAMFKNDEKLISRYLNQITVLEAKKEKEVTNG